jgi:hypothetical protein
MPFDPNRIPPFLAYVSFDASAEGDFDDTTDIIKSFNVQSVVREAKGKFAITFAVPHSDGKFATLATAGSEDYSGSGASPRACGIYERSATGVKVVVERTDDSVNEDNSYINVFVAG